MKTQASGKADKIAIAEQEVREVGVTKDWGQWPAICSYYGSPTVGGKRARIPEGV